jgi:hypothetical protein
MSAVNGETVRLGQADGTEIELVVFGDEDYARYETPAGHSVVYDAELGAFFYARLDGGRLISTGVPASEAPPPGAALRGQESAEVRAERAASRRASRAERAKSSSRR